MIEEIGKLTPEFIAWVKENGHLYGVEIIPSDDGTSFFELETYKFAELFEVYLVDLKNEAANATIH